jgi:protein TonB
MLLLLLALVAELHPPLPPPEAGGHNASGLFSMDDYPIEAVQHRWQGTVVADVTVSAEGRVSACKIVQSSGYDVLDAKTCEIMTKRARFVPAKDAQGRPTVDVVRTPPIVWRLPG